MLKIIQTIQEKWQKLVFSFEQYVAILNTVADSTKYFHIHDFSYINL